MPTPGEDEPRYEWQPVMLITRERLECRCGQAAIFVTLDPQLGGYQEYGAWCRDCWERETESDGGR